MAINLHSHSLSLSTGSTHASKSISIFGPPNLLEKYVLEKLIGTTAAVDDSSLQLDGRGRGGPYHDVFVDATLCANERGCMHGSSLSSTVLMLGRSSGRRAQHSAVSARIIIPWQSEGSEKFGRRPWLALKAASAPAVPSKARRSCVSSQSKNAKA